MKNIKSGISFVETDAVELKKEFSDSLEKDIVAFLNSKGGILYM